MADIKGIELASDIYGLEDEKARDDVETNTSSIGNLANLETEEKNSLVGAINELANASAKILPYVNPFETEATTNGWRLMRIIRNNSYVVGRFTVLLDLGSNGKVFVYINQNASGQPSASTMAIATETGNTIRYLSLASPQGVLLRFGNVTFCRAILIAGDYLDAKIDFLTPADTSPSAGNVVTTPRVTNLPFSINKLSANGSFSIGAWDNHRYIDIITASGKAYKVYITYNSATSTVQWAINADGHITTGTGAISNSDFTIGTNPPAALPFTSLTTMLATLY